MRLAILLLHGYRFFDDPANGGGGGGGGGNDPKPVTYSKDDLDRAVSQGIASALEKERRRTADSGMTEQEKTELAKYRAEQADRERLDAEAKKEYNRALESVREEGKKLTAAEAARAEKLRGELREERITNRVIAEAARLNAINPNQVARLLRDNLKLDEHNHPVVLDDKGEIRLKDGQPLTVEAAVKEFLAAEAHLVKPTQTRGTAGEGGATHDDRRTEQNDPTETADQAKLKKIWEDAVKKAEASQDPGDITRAHTAKKKYEAAARKAS